MTDEIEEFFAGYPPDMQDISRELRAIMLDAMPSGAVEVLYARQNHIGYSWSEWIAEKICYICPMRDYVRLGFMFGGYLPDPDHMLEGEGKRLRHVKVRSLDAAGDPSLRRLVEAAWVDAMGRRRDKR